MSSTQWTWTKVVLLALAAIGLGFLFGGALLQQYLFLPTPVTGATRVLATIIANVICLVPLAIVLLSAAATRRLGWRLLALSFFLPMFIAFAYVTLT